MPSVTYSFSLLILLLSNWASVYSQDSQSVEILGQYPVEQSRKDSAFIMPAMIITSEKQLIESWDKLKGGDRPKINFNSSFLVLHVRDAADPNRHRFLARIKDGQLELMALSTRIGFQRSDKTITTLVEFSRKGVVSFKAFNPKNNKQVVTPLKPSGK